jgi:hypothetical protein
MKNEEICGVDGACERVGLMNAVSRLKIDAPGLAVS